MKLIIYTEAILLLVDKFPDEFKKKNSITKSTLLNKLFFSIEKYNNIISRKYIIIE